MNDKQSHTPGPWFFDEHGNVFIDTREQVCCGKGREECCGDPDIIGDYDRIAETSPQNAPIVAAAPELLGELEKSADTFRDLAKGLKLLGNHVAAAACEIAERSNRAAIAKATGEPK